jgi:hypothetical protein
VNVLDDHEVVLAERQTGTTRVDLTMTAVLAQDVILVELAKMVFELSLPRALGF